MKKLLFHLLSFVLVSTIFLSCEKDNDLVTSSEAKIDGLKASPKLQAYLDETKNMWNQYLGRRVKMLDYKLVGTIDNEAELQSIFKEMLAPDSHHSAGDAEQPETVAFFTLKEANLPQENRDSINKWMADQIHIGDQIFETKWEQNGKIFTQKTITNADKIVWDNMIFGVYTLKEVSSLVEDTIEGTNGAVAVQTSTYSYTGLAYFFLPGHLKRGYANYKMTIYYNGPQVQTTAESVTTWMYIGTSIGKYKELKDSGPFGRAQFVVGLAAPTIAFRYNNQTVDVTISGIGSSWKKREDKVMYPPNCSTGCTLKENGSKESK